MVSIERIDGGALTNELDAFSQILRACVADGASVSFVEPFSLAESRDFWIESVLPELQRDARVLWAARMDGSIVGTVQVMTTMPPNQWHRAEVAKLLVDPVYRRRGIGRQLMMELENTCRDLGKLLITLDTRTGDPSIDLYQSLGYSVAGSIPDFCQAPDSERLDSTTYMYKKLSAAAG